MNNPTRPGPRPEHAPTKENAPGQEGVKSNLTGIEYTNPDPLMGWFSLGASVKQSRVSRHQKRGWNRQRGTIHPLALAGLLLVGLPILAAIAGRFAL
jgi:hypothetical protein